MSTPMRDVDIWLHNFLQARSVQIQRAKDYYIERILQGSEQMFFSLPINDPKLEFIHEDQLVEANGQFWLVDRFEESHPGYRTVICNARWIELSWRVRAGVYSILGQTPLDGLTTILQPTGWTVGSVPLNSDTYSMEEMDGTALGLARRWAAIIGYEVEFDTVAKTVSLKNTVGQTRPLGFRWGQNIRSIKRTFYPPPATRLYPFGANSMGIADVNPTGQPYIEDFSFYTDQGLTITQARSLYRKDLIWVDERYLVQINLFDAATARMAKLSQPRVFYEADVLDLSRLMGVDEQGFDPGDSMTVDDEIIGVLENVRVTRTIQFPNDPKRDKVELGFSSNGMLDVSTGSERQVNYEGLIPIVDQNLDPMTIAASEQTYGTITVTSTGVTIVITGSTFVGVATGTGTVQFRLAIDGTSVGEPHSFDFVNGQKVEFSFPSFAADLAEGPHDIHWRAQVTSGSGTIALAAGAGRSWVLIRGAVGIGGTQTPNQFISEIMNSILPMLGNMTDDVVVVIDELDHVYEIEEAMTAVTIPAVDDEVVTIDFDTVLGPIWLDETAVVYANDDEISSSVPASSDLDDLILCFLSQESGASDITAPAGFTRIAQSTVDDGTHELWAEVWAADDDGTMASDPLVFTAVSSGPLGLYVAVIRNVEVGTVSLDDSEVDDYQTAVLPIGDEPFGDVTSLGNNRMAIAFDACAYDDGGDAVGYQEPEGFELHTPASVAGNKMMVASMIGVMNAQTLTGLSTIHGEITAATHAAATIMLLLKAD